VRAIEALQPESEPYRVPDLRCKGLAVRVAPDGGKTWDLVYRVKGSGKVRRHSLGRVDDVSLEQARDRANALTSAARQGRDLIEEETQALSAQEQEITVQKLVERYVGTRVRGRLRTAKELERRLERTLRPLMARKASSLHRREFRALFDAAAEQGFLREAGQRRQAVKAMFKWALSQDLIETDPTAGIACDGYSLGAPRDRVLGDNEAQALWQWIGAELAGPVGDCLKVQLCLGARCGEIGGMRPEEIDRNGELWLWTLPASRSKNKKPRVTPLIGLARELIEARIGVLDQGPLFTTEAGGPLYSGIVGHHLRHRWDRLPIERFSTHDLRRTAATRMAEMGIALELVAAIIGHESAASRDTRILVRHYLRTDLIERKTAALGLWDARLRAIISGEATSNVIGLRRKTG
jgi:integrase